MLMARLSKTGDAKARSGDVESDPVKVATNGKEQITLILNRSIP